MLSFSNNGMAALLDEATTNYRQGLAAAIDRYEPESKDDFSMLIKAARKNGISFEQIADLAESPVHNVRRWEKGEHCPPMLVRRVVADGIKQMCKETKRKEPLLATERKRFAGSVREPVEG